MAAGHAGDVEIRGLLMAKLALQAALWYTRGGKSLVAERALVTPSQRLAISSVLRRLTAMDTVSQKSPKGKPYVYFLEYPESMGGAAFYIGKGTGRRINEHETEARSSKRSLYNPYKVRVIRQIWKQGEQINKKKLVYFDTDDEAYMYEFALVFFMQGYGNLTNITDGGMGGIASIMDSKSLSEEHKRKIGQANKGKLNPNKGKIRSKETGQKISAALKGRPNPNKGKPRGPFSEEHRRKLSDARRGVPSPAKGLSLGPHTEETKRKISEGLKGHVISEATRRKISESEKGKKQSVETIQRHADAIRGRTQTEEHKRKNSEAHKGKSPSTEHRRKLSKANKGKFYSEERRRNMSIGRKRAQEERSMWQSGSL